MERIISLCLVSAFVCSAASPVFAQSLTRDAKVGRTKSNEQGNRFASVRAYSDGNGVLVEWQMAVETNNAGFSVYRLDGEGTQLASESMILGSAAMFGAKPVPGEAYSFYDTNGTPGSVYYVQNLTLDGKSGMSANVAVQPVTDLSEVTTASSADLSRQAKAKRQNGNLTAERLQFPKVLASEVYANRPVADDATHAWVVSQPGVRIGVRGTGFYRVTKAELQAAGFNVNGDPNLWQLYREGVQLAILMGPNADYFDFWGKGIDTSESDTGVYYLVSGPQAGKRIATKVARPVAGSVTSPSYNQVFTQKQRVNYLSQVLNGELENFWGSIVNTAATPTSYNFTLTGVDFNALQASLEIKFQGYSFDQHIVQVTLNGEALADATGNSRSPFSKQYTVPTSFLREGTNTLTFKAIGVASDLSLFDSLTVGYARKFLAAQDKVRFYTSNFRLSRLEGFTSPNIRVFDVTNEAAPVLWTNLNVVPDGATYSVRLPADRGRSMYAMTESSHLFAASITPNDPTVLKSPSQAANLIIISHKNWMAEAENWANYRRGQGIVVKTIEVSEIYDEFNYGDTSSFAIRAFLQYAKTNWQTAPGYVLILGDASFDPRNYTGAGFNNLVPTHIVNTVFTETGSDEWLADFNGDGLAEMAVGRIAARNGQTVTNALAKVTTFEQQAPTPESRGVLFAFDQFDAGNNYDFEQISVRLRNQLPGGITSTMVGRSDTPPPPDTPQTVLINSINAGKYLVNYTGHGSTGTWATTTFFSNNQVPLLTNANNQSIFTMLTCLNGFFLHATNRSLAENLVEATNGGAVAAWASTGETTPDVQEIMATRFFLKIGQGQIPRLGDLVNDSKSVLQGGTDVRLSWALIGDPMLKVRTPTSGDRPGKQ